MTSEVLLVQVQQFGAGTENSLETLHQRGKMVKTKSQKFLGSILTFVEVTEEKLVRGGSFWPPFIPNGVNGIK